MLKGMFVNCWGCHLTIKMNDKVRDWINLEVIDNGEMICTPSFCSKAHLDSWLENDLVPLLAQQVFEKAIEEPRKSSGYGFAISGSCNIPISSSVPLYSGGGSLHRGKCITCGKKGDFRLELVIYHNSTIESKGFCSLDCLKTMEVAND